jgi:hypothetical protein
VEEIAKKIIIRFLRVKISVLFKWVRSGDFDANGEGEVVGGIVVITVKMLIKL